MKKWWIEGLNLVSIIVDAESFDEAIAIARRVNKGYSRGTQIKIDCEPTENSYKRKENK